MHRLLRITDKKLQFTIDFLQKAGFSKDSGILFFFLTKHGPLTLLQASRITGIERTKLYRISEELIHIGLIEEIVDYKKKLLKAGNLDRINLLVSEKQAQAEFLTGSFPAFNEIVHSIQQQTPTTQVLYFKGAEGVKQMLWNELSLKGEGVGYIYRPLEEVVGVRFFRKWVEEYKRKNLSFREIRTEVFYKHLKKLKHQTLMTRLKIRTLPHVALPINHQMEIYNDVTAIYNWVGNEVFGIEIHNKQVADFQRAIFDTFWKMGTPAKT